MVQRVIPRGQVTGLIWVDGVALHRADDRARRQALEEVCTTLRTRSRAGQQSFSGFSVSERSGKGNPQRSGHSLQIGQQHKRRLRQRSRGLHRSRKVILKDKGIPRRSRAVERPGDSVFFRRRSRKVYKSGEEGTCAAATRVGRTSRWIAVAPKLHRQGYVCRVNVREGRTEEVSESIR